MRYMRKVLVSIVFAVLAVLGTPHAHADVYDDVNVCGFGYGVAEGATTCGFAHNVWAAWLTQDNNPVTAYSPATNAFYEMYCAPATVNEGGTTYYNSRRCTGGNNAVVYIW